MSPTIATRQETRSNTLGPTPAVSQSPSVSASLPVGEQGRDDMRASLMRKATSPQPTTNVESSTHTTQAKATVSLEQVTKEAVQTTITRDFAGLTAEQRATVITQTVQRAKAHASLSQEQARRLQEILIDQEQVEVVKRQQEINETIERIVQQQASAEFREADLEGAYKQIRQVAGKNTSREEAEKISARLIEQRNQARSAKMLEEISQAGKESVALGSELDPEAAKRRLTAIATKYADVQGLDESSITTAFKSGYNTEYDRQLTDCNFVTRKYYEGKRWVSGAVDSLAKSFSGVTDVLKGATKLGGDVLSWGARKLERAGKAAYEFGYDLATDPERALEKVKKVAHAAGETLENVGNAIREGAGAAKDFVVKHGTNALRKAAEIQGSVIDGVVHTAKGLGGAVVDVGACLIGQKSWSEVSQNFTARMAKAGEAFSVAGHTAAAVGVGAWKVVKGLSDSLGVTSIVTGMGHSVAAMPHLMWDIGRVLTGHGSVAELHNNFMGHMKGSVNAFVGGAKCFGEVTGITDLYHAGSHSLQALSAYGRGDKMGFAMHSAQAAMHGACAAMSAGSIAATVATAGAAGGTIIAVAAGRQALKEGAKLVLKEAGKQFFEQGAKQIGEVVVKDLAANAAEVLAKKVGGKEVLQQLEKQAASELGASATKEAQRQLVTDLALRHLSRMEAVAGAKESLQQIAAKGAAELSTQTAETVCKSVGESRTKIFLKELGLDNLVDKQVFDLLKTTAEKKPGRLTEELMNKFGISKSQAKDMAKEVKKAVRSGKADGEIKQILEDGISKPVAERLAKDMEEPFKNVMRSGFKGELTEPFSKDLAQAVAEKAAKAGKTVDSYTDELVEAGWKGYKEGIEAATKSVVREGIERAFNRFRDKGHRRFGAGAGGAATMSGGLDEGIVEVDFKKEGEKLRGEQEKPRSGEVTAHRTVQTTDHKGNIVTITEAYDIANNAWVETGRNTSNTKAA